MRCTTTNFPFLMNFLPIEHSIAALEEAVGLSELKTGIRSGLTLARVFFNVYSFPLSRMFPEALQHFSRCGAFGWSLSFS